MLLNTNHTWGHNVCIKTWINLSSVSLLQFVQVFVTQMLNFQKKMDFENVVICTQNEGYNGAHMVVSYLDMLLVTDRQNLDFII